MLAFMVIKCEFIYFRIRHSVWWHIFKNVTLDASKYTIDLFGEMAVPIVNGSNFTMDLFGEMAVPTILERDSNFTITFVF